MIRQRKSSLNIQMIPSSSGNYCWKHDSSSKSSKEYKFNTSVVLIKMKLKFWQYGKRLERLFKLICGETERSLLLRDGRFYSFKSNYLWICFFVRNTRIFQNTKRNFIFILNSVPMALDQSHFANLQELKIAFSQYYFELFTINYF